MAGTPPPSRHHPLRAPAVLPPAPAVERRRAARRLSDRLAHEDASLLALALDILASGGEPDQRLAGVLGLLARTVGARRAAVLSGEPDRRVAVGIEPGEDPTDALALAIWLDQSAPRSRAQRVAAGPAPVLVVSARPTGARPGDTRARTPIEARFALIAIPSAGPVHLGFEMRDLAGVMEVAERLPPTSARHAAIALALVTAQISREEDVAAIRGRDAERDRFVTTVAHDLRTPLTALDGFLELILTGRADDPAVVREFLERSRGIVGSMAELVSDLLDIARLDSGSVSIDVAPFSIADVSSRAIASLAPLALERGVTIDRELPPRIRTASGDRRHVERILTNLIGNALKFAPPDGRVEVVARLEDLVAIIAIRDDGAGIEPGDRDRIFERFHRLSRHETIAGTGLGLPIARELARAMNGDIGVASVPGSGSSFILALPGPTAMPADTVVRVLASAVAAEESLLEGRRVVLLLGDEDQSSPSRTRGGGGPRIRSLERVLPTADSAAR